MLTKCTSKYIQFSNFLGIVLNFNFKILISINLSLACGATSEPILKNIKLDKVHNHHHLKIKINVLL